MIRSLPPLRLLTVFETVLRNGSIRAAASELNVSQPAVSQALRQLEDHVGTRLLDRTTRPPGLTEAGRLLQSATTEGLGRIAEALQDIQRLSGTAEQSVTIACSVGFATYWLMPRLAGLYETHPGIAVNVLTTSQGAPRLTASVDMAIRFGSGSWSDGEVHRLFHERVEPVCSPELAERLPREGALQAATLIHVDVDDESWTRWATYLRAIGQLPDNRRPGLRFTNYVQATQAALSHQGVMLGWRSITGDLVKQGRLVVLSEPHYRPGSAFFLVAAHRPTHQRASQTVAAWLRSLGDSDPSGAARAI
ncbi:LysR substrate-binding domain-containing protein [Tianweitania sediminis]|uniref:LysR family transcriptional regulator n=1 Tax=Tianweitania sediminis TaxID=1502156 RepID=A0A8J7QXI7_9HYPH|nr:LysR family transcriptional regulator [Tianweitania sediminis]HEV7416261.1 LysR substrate-binding domain-containing protein [Tianweitania sediminis]